MTSSISDLIAINRALISRADAHPEPYEVAVCNRDFLVLPHVFSPKYFDGTEIFCRHFPHRAGDRFLEIGSGTGAMSVFAALHGAPKVVAVDISPDAVRNTTENFRRFEVDGIAEARLSDIFSNIREDEMFDTIYWNVPFIDVPEPFAFTNVLERAVFDPGYQQNRRFISDAGRHLAPGGRVVVGFGSTGDEDQLRKNCRAAGYSIRELVRERGASEPGWSWDDRLEFVLFELRRAHEMGE